MADPVYPTYPNVKINGVEYAPFNTWNINFIDVKTIHETEAGTQEDVVINTGRRSVSVSTTCLQPVATNLVALDDLTSFPVQFYDIKTNAYIESTMRIVPGSMNCNKKPGQRSTTISKAVYIVSFTMEEFG